MIKPMLPANETDRLVYAKKCIEMVVDDYINQLTNSAAFICQTPMSLLSIVEHDKQCFKSRKGLDATETARDISFCAHAILQDDIFIIPDAQFDERFFDNPLVTGDPHIRFYAGMPLKLSSGQVIGSLCVLDTTSRTLAPEQILSLKLIAKEIVAYFDEALRFSKPQLKQSLIDDLGHELRTPLNGVVGLTDILLETELSQEQNRIVQQLKSSGDSLRRSINHLLDTKEISTIDIDSPSPETKDLKVLVVDDNTINQVVTVNLLKKMGHTSDIANNGFEAIDLILSNDYDLVLMDCQMPVCDGYEATKIIRSLNSHRSRVCILALTANSAAGDSERCIQCGMNGYISKPVSRNRLRNIIETWIQKS